MDKGCATSWRVLEQDVTNAHRDRRRSHGLAGIDGFSAGTRFYVEALGGVAVMNETRLLRLTLYWGGLRLEALVDGDGPVDPTTVDGVVSRAGPRLAGQGGEIPTTIAMLVAASRAEPPRGYAELRSPRGPAFDVVVLERLHADPATRPALLAAMAASGFRAGGDEGRGDDGAPKNAPRLELTVIGRSKGRSMPGAAAYRAGVALVDERTGTRFDFRRKRDVVATGLYGPDGALDEAMRGTAWNAAEAAERRRDSVVGREMLVSLPGGVDAGGREALARRFAAELARDEGVLVDVAVHAPSRRGDARNHHAHVIFSSRSVVVTDGVASFGGKTLVWDNLRTGGPRLRTWRERYAALTAEALDAARAG